MRLEIDRISKAVKCAQKQLQALHDKAADEIGASGAAIFEVYRMILEDKEYFDSIRNVILTEMVNTEFAVSFTGERFSEMFSGMKDDYMKARAIDIKDISARLIHILNGQEDIEQDFARAIHHRS